MNTPLIPYGQIKKSLNTSSTTIMKGEWLNDPSSAKKAPLIMPEKANMTMDVKDFLNGDGARNGKDSIQRILQGSGYFDLEIPADCQEALTKAIESNAELISRCTKGVLVNKGNREAPAMVGPDSVKVGDTVQLLNWKPLGVKGATIDLFPKGKVTKTYFKKCLVKSCDKESYEDRLEGVELDGKGPSDAITKSGKKLPYILKDSTILLRYPEMAEPSGETDHISFGIL